MYTRGSTARPGYTRGSTARPGPIKLLRGAGNVAKLRLHAGNMKFNKQNGEMNANTYNYFTLLYVQFHLRIFQCIACNKMH